jgi:arylsulfatase A-like enzyme
MDNTIIVYTSDQGFYMGEHGWFDKRFMYEESFRTPLIIRFPKAEKQGITCDALVQNIDYAPTYLAAAKVAQPDDMTGRSLIPLMNGETPDDWRSYLYYHYYDYPAIHQVQRHDGVRDKQYKLIHFYGEKGEVNCNELYDLKTDPNEINNLYGQAGYADVQQRLQEQLTQFRTTLKVDEY